MRMTATFKEIGASVSSLWASALKEFEDCSQFIISDNLGSFDVLGLFGIAETTQKSDVGRILSIFGNKDCCRDYHKLLDLHSNFKKYEKLAFESCFQQNLLMQINFSPLNRKHYPI